MLLEMKAVLSSDQTQSMNLYQILSHFDNFKSTGLVRSRLGRRRMSWGRPDLRYFRGGLGIEYEFPLGWYHGHSYTRCR